ncbi:hypothetical protein [Salinibacter phage M31CR41-2]|uniref:Uncharacterized protein n=1 Tax=Salinibacter phage M31CR41-2 TaxID=2681614 RepID=A0A2I6UH08_9CAUD|nr:hypothetical protein FGG68_gp17 [Salinibacter phage M31CR41-2]AUO79278.1 hypothetical protein [Salinibacter phage M31CR41-2]
MMTSLTQNTLSTMETRNRISITFGADNEENRAALNRFVDSVERSLTRNTGGMKRIEHSGSWRTDGNTEPPYNGELVQEPAITLSFVTNTDADRMLSVLKAVIRDEANRAELSSEAMQWVNVEIEPVHVDHFDLTEPVGGAYENEDPYEPGPSAHVAERNAAERHRPPAPDERPTYRGAPVSTEAPANRTFEEENEEPDGVECPFHEGSPVGCWHCDENGRITGRNEPPMGSGRYE